MSALDDYLAAGMLIFPVDASKRPLVAHWRADASSDPEVIKAWRERWPSCDFGYVPAAVVVVDLDVKHGKNGFADFKRFAGCDARDVLTPQWLHRPAAAGCSIIYAASKPYKNLAPAIIGTGLDTRAEGGYVVLPVPGNGRQWVRELIGADGALEPLLPAPAWLACAERREPSPRMPLVLAPSSALVSPSADPWAQRKALAQLERACARIVAAPCGAQDSTRHAQCYLVGGIIGRGDLGYQEAFEALCRAALAMPVYRDPWKNLEERVARSVEAGMAAPLPFRGTRPGCAISAPVCGSCGRARAMVDDLHGAGAAGAAGATSRGGRDGSRDDEKQPSLAAGDSIACDALAASAAGKPSRAVRARRHQ